MIIICVPNEFYNKSDSEIQRSELRNLVGNSIAQNAMVFRSISSTNLALGIQCLMSLVTRHK